MDRRDFAILVLLIILVASILLGAYMLDRQRENELCLSVSDRPEKLDTFASGFGCFVKTEEGYWVQVYGIEADD